MAIPSQRHGLTYADSSNWSDTITSTTETGSLGNDDIQKTLLCRSDEIVREFFFELGAPPLVQALFRPDERTPRQAHLFTRLSASVLNVDILPWVLNCESEMFFAARLLSAVQGSVRASSHPW